MDFYTTIKIMHTKNLSGGMLKDAELKKHKEKVKFYVQYYHNSGRLECVHIYLCVFTGIEKRLERNTSKYK